MWRVKKDKKDRTLEPQQAANHWSGSYLPAKYDDSAARNFCMACKSPNEMILLDVNGSVSHSCKITM